MAGEQRYEIVQWVEAPIEEVFGYFTVAERMAEWQGVEAKLDPRPGGLWWCRYADGAVARGEFLELDPPRHLAYSWGFEKLPTERVYSWSRGGRTPVGESRVDIELFSDGAGTRIELRHVGFHPEDPVTQGWPHFLGRLETLCRTGTPPAGA